jgi:RNA polymerase sigma-70 factor (ECF subfamily)
MTDAVAPLLERARSGDRKAYAGLVRRYLPSVRAIVRRRSKGRGVPDELVREAFHRAWAGLAGLSARAAFGRWLGGIARYVAVEAARRREPFGAARQRTSRDVTRDRVFATIEALEPGPAEALVLRHLDGLSREEVAERMALDVDAVDALLRAGRETLVDRISRPEEATLPPPGEETP